MDLSKFLPSLESFSPTLSHTDVPVLPEIWARFTIDIDTTQVDTANELNRVFFLLEESTQRIVPLNYVSYAARTLRMAPSENLLPGETYLLTVSRILRSPEGRQMGADRSWAFKVAGVGIAAPVLDSPGDLTAWTSQPTLTWDPVTVATGSIDYKVEVDDTPRFHSPLWTTVTSATSAAIGSTLPTRATYWWRVAARVTPVSGSPIWGPPSVPQAFYLGIATAASPSAPATETTTALLLSAGWEDGLSHQSAWPNLSLTLGSTIATGSVSDTTVWLESDPVDGYGVSKHIPITLSTSGSVLTILPGEAIVFNRRYTLMIEGVQLADGRSVSLNRYFTSQYQPFYVGTIAVRAVLGDLGADLPDDFINFHIYRASLDVNRHYLRWFTSIYYMNSPSEETVRNYFFNLTYDMERWVEIEASRRILAQTLLSKIQSAGLDRRLGDFTVNIDAQFVQALREEIKRLQGEANFWLAKFSRMRSRPKSARKAEQWPRDIAMEQDLSWKGRGRTEF